MFRGNCGPNQRRVEARPCLDVNVCIFFAHHQNNQSGWSMTMHLLLLVPPYRALARNKACKAIIAFLRISFFLFDLLHALIPLFEAVGVSPFFLFHVTT